MNNILAGHTNCYHGYPRETALDGLARAGFRYVELATGRGPHAIVPLEPSAAELADLRDALEARGLRIASISGHSNLTTDDGLADGLRAVDVCAALGVGLMNTSVGGTHSRDEDCDAFMARIAPLAEYAAGRGVTLGLEIHGDLMATGPQAAALVREINLPNVGINYDTANCTYYGGVQAADDIGAALPYLVHVHMKDSGGGRGEWDFPPLGQGRVDFPRLLTILQEGGYGGPLSVEIEFYGFPYPPLDEIHAAVETSFAYLERLTTK